MKFTSAETPCPFWCFLIQKNEHVGIGHWVAMSLAWLLIKRHFYTMLTVLELFIILPWKCRLPKQHNFSSNNTLYLSCLVWMLVQKLYVLSEVFCSFLQSYKETLAVVPQISSWPLSCLSFQACCSLINTTNACCIVRATDIVIK